MQTPKPLSALSSAMEDYLEAIYHLEREHRIARVRDIADRLGVKMSSVSSALRILSSRGLIRYDPHQFITLTEPGIKQAEDIVRKHEVLKRFLSKVLKIQDSAAEDNACRIEHHLDPEVIERLIGFLEFMEMCPVDQTGWVYGLTESCDDCGHCLDKAKGKLFSRAVAQEAALAGGMTLAQALPGSQVVIDSFKDTIKLPKVFAEEGINSGVIVEIEKKDADSGNLWVNIKGYRFSMGSEEASRILVKPI
ncbi:MAG: metal-dependent transcriptional regulator [Deltaproteobacteria bacterium]|nr:metal-dependent transcriptional regulator [Deltaproteobacteria bacterium]